MKTTAIIGLLAVSVLFTAPVQAANIIGSLTFTNPTGTVSGSDTIDVWATLTLAAGSDPLTFNSGELPNGVDTGDFPLQGRSRRNPSLGLLDFATYTQVGLFIGRDCTDTFTDACTGVGSAYRYDPVWSGDDAWLGFRGTIYGGESQDFKMYQLTPIGGTAASGDYYMYTMRLGLYVKGTAVVGGTDDEEIFADIYTFSTDCGADNCTFSRTVSAVPIPAAAWLFGSGLIGLVGVARRKKAV